LPVELVREALRIVLESPTGNGGAGDAMTLGIKLITIIVNIFPKLIY